MDQVQRQALLEEAKKRGLAIAEPESLSQNPMTHNDQLQMIKQEAVRRGLIQPQQDMQPQNQDVQPQEQPNEALRKAAVLGKTAASEGIAGLVDLATLPPNLAIMVYNHMKDANIPTIPSAVDYVDRKIDDVTGGYTKTLPQDKIAAAAVKGATSVLVPGGLAKSAAKMGAKGLSKGLQFLGSTSVPTIAGGAVASGVGEYSHQQGDGALSTIGKSMGAGIATDAVLQAGNWVRKPQNLIRMAGYGAKNLDVAGYEAAKRLDLPAPNAAVSNGTVVRETKAIASQIPFLGSKINSKIDAANEAYQSAWENLKGKIGPQQSEVRREIKEAYDKLRLSINENDTVPVSGILDEINKIREEIKTLSYSDTQKSLISKMDEIEQAIIDPSKINTKSHNAKEIFNQEQSLNAFMNDRNVFPKNQDGYDARVKLKRINDKIDEILQDYGKENKVFGFSYKKTKNKFSSMKKREDLENFLEGKLYNVITDDPNHASLIKVLSSRKNQEELKNILGNQFEKMQDFVKYSRMMNQLMSKKTLKSEGSAGKKLLFLAGAFYKGFQYAPLTTTAASGLLGLSTYLLTNEKFLDKAISYAKNPTIKKGSLMFEAASEASGIAVADLKNFASHIQKGEIENSKNSKNSKGKELDLGTVRPKQ